MKKKPIFRSFDRVKFDKNANKHPLVVQKPKSSWPRPKFGYIPDEKSLNELIIKLVTKT